MDRNLSTSIDRQQVTEMLRTFYDCVNLPIQLIDPNGTILEAQGSTTAFCSRFHPFLPTQETCARQHAQAGRWAMEQGESYIFACHANLNHIVFPLISAQTLLGAILVGPFLMDTPDSSLISDLGHRYSIPTDALLELYEQSQSIPIVTPAKVTQLSRLLFYMFSGLISNSYQQIVINQEKLQQQSRINESIQRYKMHFTQTPEYPYETERELITRVRTRDAARARTLLNDLLGYVFFSEGNNLTHIKARSIELCALLSRAAIEGGATNDIILKVNNQFITQIQSIDSLDELCYRLQQTLDAFVENMFTSLPGKNHELIRKAVAYIAQNFAQDLTLEDVSAHVHLNPSYFSSVFKQSTGSSFKEYLNMIRIEESKRLLTNTPYSVVDIAVAVGFEDQSYFSRVFKRLTGLTPRQYRSDQA